MKEKRVSTIKDVAKLANVAISTVSYALNDSGNVSEETKKKILKAAKELDYKPSGIARSLKTKKTEIIGLFLENFNSPIYTEIIRGVSDVVKSNGYEIAVTECMSSRKNVSRLLAQRIVDGAIVLSPNIPDKMIKEYASINFPIVTLDREIKNKFISSVLIDNKNSAYNIIKFLVQQKYKNIAILNGPKGVYDSDKRFEGFKEAVEKFNINLKDSWCDFGDFSKEAGYYFAKNLIHRGDMPEVFCAANDGMAIGILNALNEENIKVPNEVAVIGFDDIELGSYVSPKLTTVRRPAYDLGVLATYTLLNKLKGDTKSEIKMLSTELIIRDSLVERVK